MQPVVRCKNPACGKQLSMEEPRTSSKKPRGHRSREYCNNACKQAHHRFQKLQEVQEAKARIAELEQQISHLQDQLDLEQRFYQDTQVRAFRAFLRKQAPSLFIRKLLSEQLLPVRGSRALYAAYLRRQQYASEELHEFEHLWKLMLLSQA
jgi:hypothetical protein